MALSHLEPLATITNTTTASAAEVIVVVAVEVAVVVAASDPRCKKCVVVAAWRFSGANRRAANGGFGSA